MFAQNARFGRLVQRLLGNTGDIALDVEPVVASVVPLVAADAPEVYALRGEYRFSQLVNAVAVVAEFSSAVLTSPAAAQRLIIVDRIRVAAHVDTGWQGGIVAPVIPGANLVAQPLDSRLSGPGLLGFYATGRWGASSAAVVTEAQFGGIVGAHRTDDFAVGAVLQPGASLRVWGGTVNTQVLVTFAWRELSVGPTEFVLR